MSDQPLWSMWNAWWARTAAVPCRSSAEWWTHRRGVGRAILWTDRGGRAPHWARVMIFMGCSEHLGVAGGVGVRESGEAVEQEPSGAVDVDRPGSAGAAGFDPELADGATQGHAVQPLPGVEVVRQLRDRDHVAGGAAVDLAEPDLAGGARGGGDDHPGVQHRRVGGGEVPVAGRDERAAG